MRVLTGIILAGLLTAAPAMATIMQVEITGTVEYNQINVGSFAQVSPGDAFSWSFEVDSDNYLDSLNYNTRGYVIDTASYVCQIGPASLGLQDPFPGTPYFVLRDNDPAVDGFFTAMDNVDYPYPDLPLNEAGVLGQFATHFEVGYDGATLSSLDILDAVGTYDYTGLTSFYTVVLDGWAEPMGLIFDHVSIVPEPASLGLFLGASALLRRR